MHLEHVRVVCTQFFCGKFWLYSMWFCYTDCK